MTLEKVSPCVPVHWIPRHFIKVAGLSGLSHTFWFAYIILKLQISCYFLLIRSNQHNVISIKDKSDVFWNVKTVEISAEYSMAEKLKADTTLRQDTECGLLTLLGKSQLFTVVLAT